MRSEAATVAEYLKSLPEDRRRAMSEVRKVILKHLPKGYEETMNWGMISYEIPLSRYPKTYNGQPLAYAALASQKNYMSVYLMSIYAEKESENWFHAAYRATGKKLDCGKCCVRFKKLEDLPLEVIGKAVAQKSPDKYIQHYEQVRRK